jgi:very-short-patch-repair endonuclease
MTDAERKFWSRVRNRALGGFKFVRQEPIGPYFADFVCRDAGVVVEIDGGQHAESLRDRVRDAFLASAGYRVMRFWNNEWLANIDGVLEVLLGKLVGQGAPHPDHSDE